MPAMPKMPTISLVCTGVHADPHPSMAAAVSSPAARPARKRSNTGSFALAVSTVPHRRTVPSCMNATRSEISNTPGTSWLTITRSGRSVAACAAPARESPACGRVESGGRLVEHQDFRTAHERARERGTLLHAAAQLGGKLVLHPLEADGSAASRALRPRCRARGIPVFSTSGNATLSNTLMESNSAPAWKSMPNCSRTLVERRSPEPRPRSRRRWRFFPSPAAAAG